MAGGAGALILTAGVAVGVLVIVLTGAPLAAVAFRADWPAALGAGDWAAIRFTVIQASLSTLASVGLALPVARALARRDFSGRKLLIALLGAPFLLPVIAAILGLLAIFGRAGLLNDVLAVLGLPRVSIYGLFGVVLAHVFFNMPLAVRLILQGWAEIPAERFRLAATLGLDARSHFRIVELPMLRETVPGALLVIFLICLSSFAVALTLGGGPQATTIELAIYQAFRFDFDLARAAVLAVVQVLLTLSAAALLLGLARPARFGAGLDRTVQRWDGPLTRAVDTSLIALAALFLLLPLSMVILNGLEGIGQMPVEVWAAAARSLAVAALAVAITLTLALPLALFASVWRHGTWIEVVGVLALSMSPLVLGTGVFLIFHGLTSPDRLAIPVTAVVNALMALPFCLRVLIPATRTAEADFGRLADSLGLTGRGRLRWLILPRLAGPLAFCTGLTAALSIGDLGVIALFAGAETATLPLQVYRLMGAYRTEAASGAALLLLCLSFGAFWAIDRGGRGTAGTT